MKKRMRVVLISILALFVLTGCESGFLDSEIFQGQRLFSDILFDELITSNDGEAIPVASGSEVFDWFTKEGQEMLMEPYIDDYSEMVGWTRPYAILDALQYLGDKPVGGEFRNMNGGMISLDSFIGQPVLISKSWVNNVGYHDDYQKEYFSEDLSEIKSAHPEYVFVEMLRHDDEEVIKKFYERLGLDIKDVENSTRVATSASIPGPEEPEMDFVNRYEYAEFLFIDAEGKIAWVHNGELDLGTFEMIDKNVTGEHRVYNEKTDQFDQNRARIDVEMVSKALSIEATHYIETFEGSPSTILENLNKDMSNYNLDDIYGNVLSPELFEEKDYVLCVINGINNDEDISEAILKVESIHAINNGDMEIVFIFTSDMEFFASEVLNAAKNGSSGSKIFVFDSGEYFYDNTYLQESRDVTYYINKDKKVVGATNGVLDQELFDQAVEIFYAETPLYEMLAY